MSKTNTQVLFKQDPGAGWVEPSHMEVTKTAFDPDTVELKEGDVLVKVLYLSLDPYMRGRMNTSKARYVNAFEVGKPMQGGGVSQVYRVGGKSEYAKGDIVVGFVGWEEWSVIPGGQGLKKLDASLPVPLSYYLGILGMPGQTAYCGLIKLGEPKPGETVYVSGAAGAVGLVVGQIAKAKGCYVVGSAGSDEKVKVLLEEAGYDAAFNYKTVESFDKALKEYCPKGIDVYFDNVGGEMLDAALTHMNVHGRIPVCGGISQYNVETPYGVKNLLEIIGKRIKIQGFLVGDFWADKELMANFGKDMFNWVKEGKIVYKEQIDEGLESAPEAFVGMLKGRNTGKQIVKVADRD
ncbi:uncharacterized protein SPPG_06499 [Spizellomyces punctatus DAOM BR117]|uniref:Enoyl reductase (ER) domain-containing protein n=1 Tax=Spizellomyces punctatus (strain DAOM BR117) TaxID=645134 RepID=A0A0L0HB51_SPIPD|nr:uncharacterized protein SPPG_06499 [Spizellomyces punctatus DAOM BR117]KNC98089.1 hypothetical protein SPPG_06499 [Spizellomyces punctatus DAOM BR117]|eukprot:XP_016606129.1 hypothetical protein SPPG_06499 [Spizellomyces punctatus DAOM BR117]